MNKYLKMLSYCGYAYLDDQPKLTSEEVIVIDDKGTDVQCYIRVRAKKIIITFRGSESKKDWDADLNFKKMVMPYDNMAGKIKVHSGFITSYKDKNIRDRIAQIIRQYNDRQKIYITGHSYGAALAMLCAVDLQYNFPNKYYEVYLYGCPRVGNAAFVKSYNKRVVNTFRVENGNDAVTKVPFNLMGYRHAGVKIRVGGVRVMGLYVKGSHAVSSYWKSIVRRQDLL